MLRAAVFVLALVPAGAQILDLATTDDGRDVLFSSLYRLPGQPAPSSYSTTVVRYHDGKWSSVGTYQGSTLNNTPRITGDGAVVSWLRYFPCGSCMIALPRTTTEFNGLDVKALKIPTFAVSLSRNGRYAFSPGFFGAILPAVQDLQTGETWGFADGVPLGSTSVADDGTVVGLKTVAGATLPFPQTVSPPTLVRWRPGKPVEDIFVARAINRVAVAAGGHYAVFEVGEKGLRSFFQVDLETRQAQQISWFTVEPELGEYTPAGISVNAAGNRALILWGYDPERRLLYWEQGAGEAKPLAGVPEGATSAVISHDGSTAWVATTNNRLLRFDLNRGTSAEILPAFPSRITAYYQQAIPGSALAFVGSPIEGQHFRAGQTEFPVIPGDDPGLTVVQVPWEYAAQLPAQGSEQFQVTISRDGYPFELVADVSAQSRPQLQFVSRGRDRYPVEIRALSADFAQTIGTDRPALPGETIHVFMTGLGELDRPVPTGVVGPSDPPARPSIHVACAIMGKDYFNPPWQGVEVTQPIYSPGRIGLYQLDVKIPADWPEGLDNLACYSGSNNRADGLIPVGKPE